MKKHTYFLLLLLIVSLFAGTYLVRTGMASSGNSIAWLPFIRNDAPDIQPSKIAYIIQERVAMVTAAMARAVAASATQRAVSLAKSASKSLTLLHCLTSLDCGIRARHRAICPKAKPRHLQARK